MQSIEAQAALFPAIESLNLGELARDLDRFRALYPNTLMPVMICLVLIVPHPAAKWKGKKCFYCYLIIKLIVCVCFVASSYIDRMIGRICA